jgi:succinylglutamate desuccinylase
MKESAAAQATTVDTVTDQDRVFDIAEGEHVISAVIGNQGGPTLIVVGGVHGNEPAGFLALSNLSSEIAKLKEKLNGRVYFVAGNTRALKRGTRFVDTDLNRSWKSQLMTGDDAEQFLNCSEGKELAELEQLFDSILITALDEVYVIDLHSTSSEGMPFATVGDTLRNREFAQKFPVPILLGIEEELEGTLLEYLNNAGAVTLGFEGGQHFSTQTAENHRALVWLALANSGILDKNEIPEFEDAQSRLLHKTSAGAIFEIVYRHAVRPGDEFEMNPGYNNFDEIQRGQVLARNDYGAVRAPRSGQILMPLYQKLGEDGFFIGHRISPFWLWLSGVLRRMKIQNMIHILPGVRRNSVDPATLIINTSIARLFPLQIFHLLGFRRRRWINNKLIVSRRRHDTSGPFKWEGK